MIYFFKQNSHGSCCTFRPNSGHPITRQSIFPERNVYCTSLASDSDLDILKSVSPIYTVQSSHGGKIPHNFNTAIFYHYQYHVTLNVFRQLLTISIVYIQQFSAHR
jgi:hypothetical protein